MTSFFFLFLNDKLEDADSLLHNTTSRNKILGAAVPEKSLTQISLCITLE